MKEFQIDSFLCSRQENGDYIYVRGWYAPGFENGQLQAFSGKQELPVQFKRIDRPDVQAAFPGRTIDEQCGFAMKIDWSQAHKKFRLKAGGKTLASVSFAKMESWFEEDAMNIEMSLIKRADNLYILSGAGISMPKKPLHVEIYKADGSKADYEFEREDAMEVHDTFEEKAGGFGIAIRENLEEEPVYAVFSSASRKLKVPLSPRLDPNVRKEANKALLVSQPGLRAFMPYLHYARMLTSRDPYGISLEDSYDVWRAENMASDQELERQRTHHLPYEPLVSIVIPAYNPDKEFFEVLLQSIQNQTYSNWQLCIADASTNSTVKDLLKQYTDPRIERVSIKNKGISENTMEAVRIAKGEWLAFCDHDDVLTPDALYEMVRAIEPHKTICVYSDEDKVLTRSSVDEYSEPAFKPDFSRRYLEETNYICHFTMMDRSFFDTIGGLRKEYDGAQDFDLMLRMALHAAKDQIAHVPKVLYHWRISDASTAADPNAKRWAFDAGRNAVQNYFDVQNKKAVVKDGIYPGLYVTNRQLTDHPLVSVIIPNKDHVQDLRRCLDSLFSKASYDNYEVLIVENGSQTPEIFDYYKQLEQEHSGKVRILTWNEGFNYAAIHNFAVDQVNGEYLLLLNNDTEVIDEDFIEQMLGYAMEEDAGAVGIKLLYENGKIQHGGITMGCDGPFHLFQREADDHHSVMNLKDINREVMAVTAACLMLSKAKYLQAGGMDPALRVAYNDVDLNLKLRALGYENIILQRTRMHHLESISRGSDFTGERRREFFAERYRLMQNHKSYYDKGDPFYSSNFSLIEKNFTLHMKKEDIQRQQVRKRAVAEFEHDSQMQSCNSNQLPNPAKQDGQASACCSSESDSCPHQPDSCTHEKENHDGL